MTDDWQCLDLARSGDGPAWKSLFERHYPSLVRAAFFITGSLECARDVAQEAFVCLLSANVRQRDSSFKSFLGTIAYRLALKERMRLHRLRKLESLSIADDSPSTLEMAVRDETDRLIVRAIQTLAVEYREVLSLRFFGEHSYEEIARIMEIPIGTVKSRIFYAIKACREKLKVEGVLS
jgi:RNA polymerase sigma-70 factor (ECF subfamily)